MIRIEVAEGSYKPYYLKPKGMKPTGGYVRQGTSSVQASPEQIRQMIKESDGDTYEDTRCLEQNLTFRTAESAFDRYGVEFSVEKYRALGITQNDTYTNLALLLSYRCHHTTKIAVFKDEFCTEFRDSKEFGGSVFKQFEGAVNYLALCNKTVSTIKGLIRTDKQDYPEEAIREALLNARVHRDYGFVDSIIINVNDGKIEFISLGELLPGLSTEDIRIGVSQPRNKKLAEVFYHLRLIERYGTGIRRIFELHKNCPVQPSVEATANAFRIVLPNMNVADTANEDPIRAHGFFPMPTPHFHRGIDPCSPADAKPQDQTGSTDRAARPGGRNILRRKTSSPGCPPPDRGYASWRQRYGPRDCTFPAGTGAAHGASPGFLPVPGEWKPPVLPLSGQRAGAW